MRFEEKNALRTDCFVSPDVGEEYLCGAARLGAHGIWYFVPEGIQSFTTQDLAAITDKLLELNKQ